MLEIYGTSAVWLVSTGNSVGFSEPGTLAMAGG
jgi:hypothetical protein